MEEVVSENLYYLWHVCGSLRLPESEREEDFEHIMEKQNKQSNKLAVFVLGLLEVFQKVVFKHVEWNTVFYSKQSKMLNSVLSSFENISKTLSCSNCSTKSGMILSL